MTFAIGLLFALLTATGAAFTAAGWIAFRRGSDGYGPAPRLADIAAGVILTAVFLAIALYSLA
mgnify:CR=1 FL=1